MANVLPKETLHEVRGSYRSRFVLVGSLVALAAALVALLTLVPAFLIVRAERQQMDTQVVELPQSDERDDVMRAQVLVRTLKPIALAGTSSLAILGEVFSARPSSVKISSIGLVKGQGGTIAISGRASSREDINAYRAELSKNPAFETVTVPIGAFVGAEAGNFSMTITGNF